MYKVLIGLFSLLLTTSALADVGFIETKTDPIISKQLDIVIDRAITDKRIVGTVVLVAKDGKIIYHRAAGFADREAKTPMQEDSIFRLSSVTKPFVSATLMHLIEEGQLSLDDPVTRWLPDFKPQLPDKTTPVITIRQLLTHTSGLSYRFQEPKESAYQQLNISDGLDQPDLGLDENLLRIKQAPLVFNPGESWRYSLGLDVLGAVIEKVTHKSLSQAVRDSVMTPLKMSQDTGFSVTDPARLVAPYADGKPEPSRMPNDFFAPFGDTGIHFAPSRALNKNSYESGGAGMVGTANDLLLFLETIRKGGGSILKPETVTAMMHLQVSAKAETLGPGWGFGYGWAVLDDPKGTQIPLSKGTIQWRGVYGHNWFVDPEQKITVVILTNTTFEGMAGALTTEIRDAVYNHNSDLNTK